MIGSDYHDPPLGPGGVSCQRSSRWQSERERTRIGEAGARLGAQATCDHRYEARGSITLEIGDDTARVVDQRLGRVGWSATGEEVMRDEADGIHVARGLDRTGARPDLGRRVA